MTDRDFYRTHDTDFAVWAEWKKGIPLSVLPKDNRGRAHFLFLGVSRDDGAQLAVEYKTSEFYGFASRRRTLISSIPSS